MHSGLAVYRWGVALLLACIAFFFIDWGEVVGAFKRKHVFAVLLVQPIQFFIIFLLGWRFSALIKTEFSILLNSFLAYLLSIGLNSFLPGRISEIVKISYLKEWSAVPASSSTVALVMERVIDLVFLGGLVLLGLGSFWIEMDEPLILLVILCIVAFFLCFHLIAVPLKRIALLIPLGRVREFILRGVSTTNEIIRSRGFLLALLLSVLTWLGSFILVYVVLKIVHGNEIALSGSLIIYSAMAIGRSIPGLPGGIGTYEAAIVLAMGYMGFGFSESFATALTLHASQLIFVTLVSLVVLGKKGSGVWSFVSNIRGK